LSDVRVLSLPACDLGESPHWHAPTSTLSWVDLHAGVLHQLGGDGCREYSFATPLSAARPAPDSATGLVIVHCDRIGVVADPAADVAVRWRATVPLGAADRCIGWSPDRDEVYVVDTATSTVHSARLDDRGLPATPFETLLDLAERPGVPDGAPDAGRLLATRPGVHGIASTRDPVAE
jgi:sugar lactone lactonase YvrE